MTDCPIAVIQLLGPPKGKGRPRTRVIGEFATIFTDKQTRDYENALKKAGIAAMDGQEPIEGPLAVVVIALMPIPPSWSRKKQLEAAHGRILPTSGIDLDNIVKMLDGLNYHPPRHKGDREKRPIIWRNDSQIVSLQAHKAYDLFPRLEITVWHWNT